MGGIDVFDFVVLEVFMLAEGQERFGFQVFTWYQYGFVSKTELVNGQWRSLIVGGYFKGKYIKGASLFKCELKSGD